MSEDAKLGLKSVNLKAEYNTDDDDIVRDFYGPCLKQTIEYDRAVGYFRANIYRILGEDLLNFVIKGGKVRIVCSPDMPESDERAAREGYDLRGKRKIDELNSDLLKVLEVMSKNPEEEDCLEMLRLLIENNSLELLIAIRTGGIYHRKVGRFKDSYGNTVLFSGSGNETSKAVAPFEDWSNDEDFDVYKSWGESFEAERVQRKGSHLEALFSGGSGKTKVRPLNKVEIEYLSKFRSFVSLEDCRSGAYARVPSFEHKENRISPYYYQTQAALAWQSAGRVGILSMATSTGKTFTALFAVKELLEGGHPLLIIVPSKILMDQWKEAVKQIYGNIPILFAGGGYSWKTNPDKQIFVSQIKEPRVLLATMDTAATDDFMEFFGQASDPILIVDEVHAIGSPIRRGILELDFFAKLGLSATPERLFDEEGTLAITQAFRETPVFDLSIGSSVKLSENDSKEVPILGHFLSTYEYLFRTTSLNKVEQKEWDELSTEIKRLAAIAHSKSNDNTPIIADKEKLVQLLVNRSRIVKKASGKIASAIGIIRELYPNNGKWIIYCEDEEQLDSVIQELKTNFRDKVILKYHSKMSENQKQNALQYFENNPAIIVSIRCLDEGVDIPSTDGAIILASSSNPRQYIQRRGRVLRRARGKAYATIIDVLVTPEASEEGIPFSIIRSELARAWNFAQYATNKEVSHELWQICFKYGVSTQGDASLSLEDSGD